jgi:dynein heavy chain
MPVIHVIPLQDDVETAEDYQCPRYKTNIRAGILNTTGQSTNYVLHISLPTDQNPSNWVLMGTDMVTMTNE